MEASAHRGCASVNSLLPSAFGKFLGTAVGSKCTLGPQRGAVMCRASIRFQFSEYGSSCVCRSTARGGLGREVKLSYLGLGAAAVVQWDV